MSTIYRKQPIKKQAKKNSGLISHLTASLLIASSLFTATSLQAVCISSIIESTPNSQLNLNGDGTATDNKTNLIWMRCSLGKTWNGTTCTGAASTYNWQTALTTAENTSFANSTSWRLPNIKELASIAEEACFSPAINQTVFPTTESSWFWSSSPDAGSSNSAWVVSFNSGNDNTNDKSLSNRVRLVRTGQ